MAKKLTFEYIRKGFEERNYLLLENDYVSSSTLMKYQCLTHPNENLTTTWNRLRDGDGCDLCLLENTCLWATNPEIAILLEDKDIGYKVKANSHKKTVFVCSVCGYKNKMIISNVNRRGFKCGVCSDGVSYPEKFVGSLLNQLGIEFERQKVFSWSQNAESSESYLSGQKRYDFYIHDIETIIETHGVQHYELSFEGISGKPLSETVKNDELKEQLAKKNGIKNYIVLDCSHSDMNFIKKNILESQLNNLYDLSNVNWLECSQNANRSLIDQICSAWNERKYSTYSLAKSLKLSVAVVIKYLKRGNELGLCVYDAKATHIETLERNHIKNKKPVLQFTKSGEFIKKWNSLREASKELGICETSISKTCKGINKSSGGFKWRYEN